jgi:hypothetical protein
MKEINPIPAPFGLRPTLSITPMDAHNQWWWWPYGSRFLGQEILPARIPASPYKFPRGLSINVRALGQPISRHQVGNKRDASFLVFVLSSSVVSVVAVKPLVSISTLRAVLPCCMM